MPLERIQSYYVVRVLRVAIPIIVLALVGVLVWTYRTPPTDRLPIQPPPPTLVENISELAEKIRFFQTEGGETTFTVEAETNLGYADGRNLLEDVTVTLYDDERSGLERLIRGDLCGYDEETQDIRCDGSAELQLDPSTSVRTSAMTYDHARRTISTLDAAQIARLGQFNGRADRMNVLIDDNVLEVNGGVRIEMADGSILESDSARYNQNLSFVEAAGGIRMKSEKGSVFGSLAEIELDPIRLDLRHVRVLGGVGAELYTDEDRLTLEAEELVLTFAGGRVVEAQASGLAVLESMGPEQGQGQRTLAGDHLDAEFDSLGRVHSVEARGDAEMVLAGGERLRSDWIRNELTGSVWTAEDSLLELGDYRVEGSYFVVERGDLIRFRTDRSTSMQMPNGSSRGQQTEAAFDPNTGAVVSLVHTGEAQIVQGERVGEGDRAELQSGGNRVVLTRNASIRDVGFQIDAAEIVLDQQEESFAAEGVVRTLWSEGSEPILVLSGQAKGNEDRITFFDGAELWSGNSHVRAVTIEVDPIQRDLSAIDEVVSTFDDLRFWSDRMDFDEQTGELSHSGNVRALSDAIELNADDVRLTLEEGEPGEVLALGNVRIDGPEFNGRSDRAVYVRSTGTITLTGEDAEVFDSSNGVVRGCRLVFNVESRDATVDSEADCRVFTRRTVD